MKVLSVFHSAVLLCVVFESALAQNRGNSRYVPTGSGEYESESNPRVPSRRSFARRARPASSLQSSVLYEESPTFQSSTRQNGDITETKRLLSRNEEDQYAPAHVALPSSKEEPLPLSPPIPDEPHVPASPPENKQGRKRRQKKRRRPQNTRVIPEAIPQKQDLSDPDIKNKESVDDQLVTNERRSSSHLSDTRSFNNPNIENSNSKLGIEDNSWPQNSKETLVEDSEALPYFPPQTGTNRLPIGDSESIDNSRRHIEVSSVENIREVPRRYNPPTPEINLSLQRESYVPILTPNRGSSHQPTHYSYNRHSEEKRQEQTLPLSRNSSPITSNNQSPSLTSSNTEQYIRNNEDKPSDNIIIGSNEPGIPAPRHGEVRLPLTEQPLIAPEYDQESNSRPRYDEDKIDDSYQTNEKPVRHNAAASSQNSFSNPSISDYDRVNSPHLSANHKEFSDNSDAILLNRRQEASRNFVPSYPPEREISRQRNNNPNLANEKKASIYQPPLQRSGSRYRPDESDVSLRSATVESPRKNSDSSEEVYTNVRSTSNYQPENYNSELTRTHSSSLTQPDSSDHELSKSQSSSRSRSEHTTSHTLKPQNDYNENVRSRSRSSSIPQDESIPRESSRARGSTRYQSETIPSNPIRTEGRANYYSVPVEEEVSEKSRSSIRGSSHSELNDDRDDRTYQIDPQNKDFEKSPIYPEVHTDAEYDSGDISDTQRLPASINSNSDVPERYDSRQSYRNSPPLQNEQERAPSRYNLQPRPQFDRGNSEQPYLHDETLDGRSAHKHDYEKPRQTNQRTTSVREQPEYQVPRQPAPTSARGEVRNRTPPQRQQSQNLAQNHRLDQNQATRRKPTPQPPRHQEPSQRHQEPSPRHQEPSPRHQEPLPRHQEPLPRHQEPSPSTNIGRPSSNSRFKCPEQYGFYADSEQCDKYYECRNGTAVEHLCEDGLAFNEISAPKYLRCDSLRDVDCSSRPELQKAHPTKNCPRRFGLFPHETDCTKFWNCVDGTSSEVQCPPGLIYNDDRATCDWADLVKSSCKTEDLIGFTCPEPSPYDLRDGVYSRYPHPDNCQLHFTCIKGDDGLRRPRLLSCNEGLVFDPQSTSCKRPDDVPGCENFYGSRSSSTNRKPAREPEEEIEEEPKTRRRNQNRRTRN